MINPPQKISENSQGELKPVYADSELGKKMLAALAAIEKARVPDVIYDEYEQCHGCGYDAHYCECGS